MFRIFIIIVKRFNYMICKVHQIYRIGKQKFVILG